MRAARGRVYLAAMKNKEMMFSEGSSLIEKKREKEKENERKRARKVGRFPESSVG